MTEQQTDEDTRLTVSEAIDLLTIGEVGMIERRHGKNFDDLSGTMMTASLIWAMERRKPGVKFNWTDVEAFTFKKVGDYFKPEPVEDIDPDAPVSESGKDDTAGE